MISRYQKSGGFLQLLKLVETSGKAKQENFLNIIDQEDPRWAAALRQKMISIEKIMSWDDNVLAEIFSRINELTLSTALHGFTAEQWARISKTFSHTHIRKIDDLKNSRQPNAGEINASFVKVIEDVRTMITEGSIKMDRIDHELVIGENIEDRLSKGETNAPIHAAVTDIRKNIETSHSTVKVIENSNDSSQIKDLNQKLIMLLSENSALKNEVKALKERLGQIKKLSA